MAGFPFTRQVGRQRFAHEAATLRVRFRYGSRICFLRLQPTVFRRVLLRSLHVRTSNLHGGLLTSHKIKPGLSWRTARQQAITNDEGGDAPLRSTQTPSAQEQPSAMAARVLECGDHFPQLMVRSSRSTVFACVVRQVPLAHCAITPQCLRSTKTEISTPSLPLLESRNLRRRTLCIHERSDLSRSHSWPRC